MTESPHLPQTYLEEFVVASNAALGFPPPPFRSSRDPPLAMV
jgi:hypothetical protein